MSRTGSRPKSKPSKRAILVQRQTVDIEDMSRGGCRLASSHLLPVGAVGVLAVDIEGQVHAEVFRVSRSGARPGEPGHFEAGVEFLPMPAESPSLHDLAAQFDQAHGR